MNQVIISKRDRSKLRQVRGYQLEDRRAQKETGMQVDKKITLGTAFLQRAGCVYLVVPPGVPIPQAAQAGPEGLGCIRRCVGVAGSCTNLVLPRGVPNPQAVQAAPEGLGWFLHGQYTAGIGSCLGITLNATFFQGMGFCRIDIPTQAHGGEEPVN